MNTDYIFNNFELFMGLFHHSRYGVKKFVFL